MTFLGKPTSGDSINNSISRDTTEILYQYQGKSFQGQACAAVMTNTSNFIRLCMGGLTNLAVSISILLKGKLG